MRTLLLFFLVTCMVSLAFSQENKGKYTSENMDASQIPESVKTAQETYYSGIKVNQWKKNTLITKQGKTYIQYVAWFMHNKKQFARAQYTQEGKGKYGIVYYGIKGLPNTIKDAVMAAHPEFKITSGQHVKILSSSKKGWRIVQKKGFKKLISWVDEEGKELRKEYVAEAYKDLWGIEQ